MQSTDYYSPQAVPDTAKKADTVAVAAFTLGLSTMAVYNSLPHMLPCGIVGLIFGVITLILGISAIKKGATRGKKVMAGFGIAFAILALISGIFNTYIAVFVGEQALLDYINDMLEQIYQFAD